MTCIRNFLVRIKIGDFTLFAHTNSLIPKYADTVSARIKCSRPTPPTPLARAPSPSVPLVTIRTQTRFKMFTMSTSMTTLKAQVAAKAVAVRVIDARANPTRARTRRARGEEGISRRAVSIFPPRGIARTLSTIVIVGGECAV